MSLSNGMSRNFFFFNGVYLAQEYLQFNWCDMYSFKLISLSKVTQMCFVIPQFGFQMGTHRRSIEQEERLATLYIEFIAVNCRKSWKHLLSLKNVNRSISTWTLEII